MEGLNPQAQPFHPGQLIHQLCYIIVKFHWIGLQRSLLTSASRQIIGTSAIRISWGKNSMSKAPMSAHYNSFTPYSAPAAPGLQPEPGFPYYRPAAAASSAVDPYAAYVYAMQQQASQTTPPLLQVRPTAKQRLYLSSATVVNLEAGSCMKKHERQHGSVLALSVVLCLWL